MFPASEPVSRIDDHGWTVRAESVPLDEEVVSEEERMLHVYHFHFDGDRKQVRAMRPTRVAQDSMGPMSKHVWHLLVGDISYLMHAS